MDILLKYLDVILIILGFILYLILWNFKRYELKKETGIEANVIFKAKNPIQKYFGFLESLMTKSIVIIILLHFLIPKNYLITTRFFGDENIGFKLFGLFFILLGTIICRISQTTIGKSWRVGIDINTKPGLITNGIYSKIRNPTYTGLYILCMGIFIILPTMLISHWILSFFLMMEFQVRCEEEYLEQQYGTDYKNYYKNTKRYLPFLY